MRHPYSKHLRELAALCGGIAFFVVGVLLPFSASATTWLGAQQGVPATAGAPYNGQTAYPAYTQCAVNASCSNYGYDDGSYAQCNDYPGDGICNGGAQPSNPYYAEFWAGVFSVHPYNSTAGLTKYISAYWNGSVLTNLSVLTGPGSAPSVAAGSQLTLEWSCLPTRQVFDLSHQSGTWQNLGTFVNLNPLTTSTTGGGSGFSTGGIDYGTQTITAPSTGGTYTYTLACNSSYGLPTMSIPVTVTVTDNCPTSATVATTQHGSGLQIGSGTYNVEAQGYNFCVTNNGASTYFLPTNSATELQTFLTSLKSGYLSTFISESCHNTGTPGTC